MSYSRKKTAGLLRRIDANLNRAREAARVVEDIARFSLDDAGMYRALRNIRLGLGRFAGKAHISSEALLAARRSARDVGRKAPHRKPKNSADDEAQTVSRNFARLQEAIRSLEECARSVAPHTCALLQSWRFRAYDLHKKVSLTLGRRSRLEGARLYALLTARFAPLGLERTARLLLKGGVDIIQVREKSMSDSDLIIAAGKIAKMCRAAGAISIINDRPDIAMAAGADGVHLGAEDMPIAGARAVMGEGAIIGASTRSLAMARRAVKDGADYVAIGPVRKSGVAVEKKPISDSTLRAVIRGIKIPVFAIGGIDADNLRKIMKSGVRCLAACSALSAADDPAATARGFLKILSKRGSCKA